MTISGPLKKFYDKVLVVNAATGLQSEQLLKVFNFHLREIGLEQKLQPNMLLPLTEMYLEVKGWSYAIDRKRGSTLIRGIGFSKAETERLANLLDRGLLSSSEAILQADALYTDVFK